MSKKILESRVPDPPAPRFLIGTPPWFVVSVAPALPTSMCPALLLASNQGLSRLLSLPLPLYELPQVRCMWGFTAKHIDSHLAGS